LIDTVIRHSRISLRLSQYFQSLTAIADRA
jgi:hypothetical protein